MRVTVVAVERLMRRGYIRNTGRTKSRYVNAGLVWLARQKEGSDGDA
jgi:hypothetical protein